MRILAIGDIVGRPGKQACAALVPRLIREERIDLVVANAENAAAGSGLTPEIFRKLRHQGIDVCTMGDHLYRRRELVDFLPRCDRILRPANLPPEAVGHELTIVPARDGSRVAVFCLLGRTYMNVRADCPLRAADRILAGLSADVQAVIVDIHAEATAEKVALGWYLDGRVTAVVGTHTHVQTADARVLPGGTAYITDLGMTGPHDSVLGRCKQAVLASLRTGMPHPWTLARGDIRLSGAIIETDGRRATGIRAVSLPLPAQPAGDAPPPERAP